MAYLSLLSSAAGEAARDFGIRASTKVASAQTSKRDSGETLKKINARSAPRFFTKTGSTGLVNLSKLVQVLGGIVGGGINVLVTRQIGKAAIAWLRGPPPGDGKSEVTVIDGVID